MSFIPDGTSRLYLEEISEPDHFRCTQENPQHECSCVRAGRCRASHYLHHSRQIHSTQKGPVINRRLNNPLNALLVMRKIGDTND